MIPTGDKPDFATDGRAWPHRDNSRFVTAEGLTFHVQTLGKGKDIVLFHGTGAATHSFRALMPILARTHRVTAFDLPGHGFTDTPIFTQMTLPGVARASANLLSSLDLSPVALVGHSAGVAVALRMVLDGSTRPQVVVGFNAALKPFAGAAGPFFSALAKVLFVNPMTPRLFSASASRKRVEGLLRNTGSKVDGETVDQYRTLFRRSGHVSGALAMMAGWDLNPLRRDLERLHTPLVLVAAAQDRTVPPSVAAQSLAKVKNGKLVRMKNLGHLAHEEAPEAAANIVLNALAETTPAPSPAGGVGD
ncbi:MAG: alpha/beta fold hydrolase [Devosia sp.]